MKTDTPLPTWAKERMKTIALKNWFADYQPIYDNSFDDLIEKLNRINL